MVLLLAPFAPHLAEELWELLGHQTSVSLAPFPQYSKQYLQEDSYAYPIAINGKVRAKVTFEVDTPATAIEQVVLTHESIQKWLKGQKPKQVIIIPQRMINIVLDN